MTPDSPTIRSLSSQLLERYPPSNRLTLEFGDFTIGVQSNSADLVERLREYFGAFLVATERTDMLVTALEGEPPAVDAEFTIKQPDPGKTKIKEEFVDVVDGRVVRKVLTGLMLLFGDGTNIAVGPCEANDNQVVNFINNRYIERLLLDGCLLGHAAGVVHGDSGLALAGFSGMGKSTLALHLMSNELQFVSNDRVLVRPNDGVPHMLGVPKQPRINPGTALHNPDLQDILPDELRPKLLQMPSEELWQLELKYDVMIEDVYGEDRFRLTAPMQALVILNWYRTSETTRVTEVSLGDRRDLLGAFIKDPGLFFKPPESVTTDLSEDAYVEALSHCRTFEISGGVDFAYATEACLEIMGKHRSVAPEER
ncbi:HprK-related kinase B [candidate division GN15 bacterium]|nr:HprK-related kinase B [candidate division GN15 bacterium]